MNTQDLIELYLQQQLNNQNNSSNTLSGYLNNVNNIGGNLQTAGKYLSGVNNNVLNNVGSGATKAGKFLQGGVSAIKNIPQNVFKGFAQAPNPAIESAISDTLGTTAANIGTTAGANAGMGAIGNAVADTAGSSLAGIGSTIGTESAAAGGAAAGGVSSAAAAGPVGALVALGAMALQGANRKRAKQGSENLMKQTNQMAKAVENDTSAQDFANQIVKQSQNNIAGNMTGGASPIEPNVVGLDNEMSQLGYSPEQKMAAMNGLNGGDRAIANLVDKYNISKPQADTQAGQISENVQADNTENIKQGLLNGLMSKLGSGFGDFAKGYQENRNTAFAPENMTQDRFTETTTTTAPSQQLIDYQNNLRNQGMDENIVNAVALGKNSGNKDIDEWIKANPEALKPVSNTQTTYTGKEKGKMARLGEGIGTVGRALQKPAVQALLAGGLSTALTGNPLYGLGQAYKFANARAMNDVYRDVLKQNGIETPDTGMFGNVTSQDMRNIGNMAETHAWHQYLNQKNADELARKIAKDEVDRKYKENKMIVDKQNADARTTSANARALSAQNKGQKGGKGSGSNKPLKPQQRPNWGKDLAEYSSLSNNPKYATRMPQIKARFIQEYGVDPDKYLK